MNQQELGPKAQRILAHAVALLETLAEEPRRFVPKSLVYLAFGSDLDLTNRVCGALSAVGYCEVTSETVKILPKGLAEVERVKKLRSSRKAEEQKNV